MPAYDKFLIAPYSDGLVRNRKPWLIPDNAFAILRNAYVYRDRVRKRWGSSLIDPDGVANPQLSSRLRIDVGTTDGNGDIVAGTVPDAILAVGQMFSVGTEMYTINTPGVAVPMLSTGAGGGAVSTGTNSFTITGAPALTTVYWYPALPVMGIIKQETTSINDENTIFFDTKYAYQYAGSGFERLDGEVNPGDATWTGTESDFFWGTMYRGIEPYTQAFFATNYVTADGIRTFISNQWEKRTFTFNSDGDQVDTARIIVQFKNRLLLLNTVETIQPRMGVTAGTFTYGNRCRFSQNGSPFESDAWFEPPGIYGKGDHIDAPTNEAIVSAEFLRDRLIVFFEQSTWELVYTGNQVLPFVWQKINTELGAESTFSIVPFDKAILGIGDVGIHACTGSNVERIDEKIPDEVFRIHNTNAGTKRVYGIRDYDSQFVFWSYPSIDASINPSWPNKILAYNYRNNSWAIFDDSVTCFGYFQPNYSRTWASSTEEWQEALWTWESGQLQSLYRTIVAGNQEGYIFFVERNTPRNAPNLQLTDATTAGVLTIIDHNLTPGEFISIENAQGITGLNDIYEVQTVIDADTITIAFSGTGTYTGGGTIARVSRIDIRTKPYNFYTQQGMNVAINKVDFNVERTATGAITVDYSPSFSTLSLVDDGHATNAIHGTNVLETSAYLSVPLEAVQDQLWHPIYFYGEGETISFRLYYSEDQMLDEDIVFSDFQLNAMLIYAQPGSGRLE